MKGCRNPSKSVLVNHRYTPSITGCLQTQGMIRCKLFQRDMLVLQVNDLHYKSIDLHLQTQEITLPVCFSKLSSFVSSIIWQNTTFLLWHSFLLIASGDQNLVNRYSFLNSHIFGDSLFVIEIILQNIVSSDKERKINARQDVNEKEL